MLFSSQAFNGYIILESFQDSDFTHKFPRGFFVAEKMPLLTTVRPGTSTKSLTRRPPAQRTDLEVFHVMAIDLSKTKKNRSQKKTGE